MPSASSGAFCRTGWTKTSGWPGRTAPWRALEVKTPKGAKLTHRDYLGSLMGLGITREKIGDILIGETGAQVIVLRETLPILLAQWEKAGRYPVTLTPLPLDQLTPTPGETKEVRATVASVRLDAVVSAGFSIPRSVPPISSEVGG